MTEIEIKAHVQNPEVTEEKIRSFAVFHKRTEKSDTYWKQESTGLTVRIRTEKNQPTTEIDQNSDTIVTYKKKTMQEKTEINEEHEFNISNYKAFKTFLQDLRFNKSFEKTKNTSSFSYAYSNEFTVTIELSQVPPLGYFIELEIMSETKDPKIVACAKKALFSTLKKCDIPETNIETRYYSEMLEEPVQDERVQDEGVV